LFPTSFDTGERQHFPSYSSLRALARNLPVDGIPGQARDDANVFAREYNLQRFFKNFDALKYQRISYFRMILPSQIIHFDKQSEFSTSKRMDRD
jgi:hypothetical protein